MLRPPIPDDLLTEIRWLYGLVGRFLYADPERWELGFRLDLFRRREVRGWGKIALAWQAYCRTHGLDESAVLLEVGRQIISALAILSMGGHPSSGSHPTELATIQQCAKFRAEN